MLHSDIWQSCQSGASGTGCSSSLSKLITGKKWLTGVSSSRELTAGGVLRGLTTGTNGHLEIIYIQDPRIVIVNHCQKWLVIEPWPANAQKRRGPNCLPAYTGREAEILIEGPKIGINVVMGQYSIPQLVRLDVSVYLLHSFDHYERIKESERVIFLWKKVSWLFMSSLINLYNRLSMFTWVLIVEVMILSSSVSLNQIQPHIMIYIYIYIYIERERELST